MYTLQKSLTLESLLIFDKPLIIFVNVNLKAVIYRFIWRSIYFGISATRDVVFIIIIFFFVYILEYRKTNRIKAYLFLA